MPLQATSGAASYDAFGGGVPVVPAYIEEVFSTWLYTGTRATQTITNGIDLSTKGGLVWIKERNNAGYDHALFDTARGVNKQLRSNLTNAEITYAGSLTAFNTTGFTLGADSAGGYVNDNLSPHASWTFRKQPKFFDVVTWTGDGTSSRAISHALGSAPGCIIVKRTSGVQSWFVYHRSLASTDGLVLTTQAADSGFSVVSATSSTTFTIYTTNQAVNTNGDTYVAYVFAHNAGGFGLTGTDNVISCGSFTTNASGGATVNLGYEPQWILLRATNVASNWQIIDNMRGWSQTAGMRLQANTTNAEADGWATYLPPNATGFTMVDGATGPGENWIYVTIRRGPMKTPTSGTSVFAPVTQAGLGTVSTGFPVDFTLSRIRATTSSTIDVDRLRGSSQYMFTDQTAAEANAGSAIFSFDNNTGYKDNNYGSGTTPIYLNFRRAPGFFDEVCFTPTGVAHTEPHNLGVAPELIIGKQRDNPVNWLVYAAPLGNTQAMYLNTTDIPVSGSYLWNNTSPTASNFSVGNSGLNSTGGTKSIAYLFASCPGVSKVGSYTGTGALQTINCGFTGGARFVLIKRTDSTGDWWVYDSARGITSGNDPYLFLNSTAAEVTGTNYVDTDTTGFKVTAAAPAGLNASGGSYIFLAIA